MLMIDALRPESDHNLIEAADSATVNEDSPTITLRCDADDITIEAAQSSDGGESLPRFSMVAYTGAPMQVGSFMHPVVVDLEGMKIADRLPVRFNHSSYSGIGHTTRVHIENGRLLAEGVFSRDTDEAREVATSGKRGFPWQASIGAAVLKAERISEKETVTVNGRTIKGPVTVARETRLLEISFVDRGADGNTSARVAAKESEQEPKDMNPRNQNQSEQNDPTTNIEAKEGGELTPPKTPENTITAIGELDIKQMTANAREEMARQQSIREMTAEVLVQRPELADELEKLAFAAIEAKWKPDKYQLEVMRLGRSYNGIATPRRQEKKTDGEILEAALCIAGGLETNTLESHFSEQSLDAASKQYRHGLGLCETLLIFAQVNGYRGLGRSDLKELLSHAFAEVEAAGISNLSLPGILSNVANKFLRAGFDAVESTWREISAIRSVRDFKQVSSYTLTGGFEYEEVAPGGELHHATAGETAYTNQAKTYGWLFGIDRRDLINDDLDALTSVPRRLGRGGALKLNSVFWTEFLNNSTFFVAANNNHGTGANTDLGVDGLTQAEQMFLDQTDPNGHPLGALPVILLVPNGLTVTAAQLMKSTEIRQSLTGTETYGTINPHSGKFRTVRSSYLSNTQFPGNSATAWYLLADPNDMPVIEVAFLNGRQRPTVDSADADFNNLGIQMRGYHDFGVAKQEPRGGVRMNGV